MVGDDGVNMRTCVVVVAPKGEYGLHQCLSHMALFTYQGLYLSAANTPKPAKHPAPTPARTPAMCRIRKQWHRKWDEI